MDHRQLASSKKTIFSFSCLAGSFFLSFDELLLKPFICIGLRLDVPSGEIN
jgi:hypothetical protein